MHLLALQTGFDRFIFFPLAILLAFMWTPLVIAQEANDAMGCSGKEIVIADLQWPSASILAHIHAQFIAQHLNCKTKVSLVDIESAVTTLKAAQTPTLIPELWTTRVTARWNAVLEAGAGFAAGDSYDEKRFEGWFVSQKMAGDFPVLQKVSNLSQITALYQLQEKPDFISCPPDWGCAVLNRNMLKAFGLEGVFQLIEPKNRLEMDALISQAISKNAPTVFYYWQPNGLFENLALKQIDLGDFFADAFPCLGQVRCKDLTASNFTEEQVKIILSNWVRGEAAELLPYARKATMPISTMNELLALQIEQDLSTEAVGKAFFTRYPSIWQSWLPK